MCVHISMKRTRPKISGYRLTRAGKMNSYMVPILIKRVEIRSYNILMHHLVNSFRNNLTNTHSKTLICDCVCYPPLASKRYRHLDS